eukprot:973237-Lingulodinium_polyedra.AAC.1
MADRNQKAGASRAARALGTGAMQNVLRNDTTRSPSNTRTRAPLDRNTRAHSPRAQPHGGRAPLG